jgi:hypothetical protein
LWTSFPKGRITFRKTLRAIGKEGAGSKEEQRAVKTDDQNARISPVLQSWLTNVLIPALVDQFVSEQGLTSEVEKMRESQGHRNFGEVQTTQ